MSFQITKFRIQETFIFPSLKIQQVNRIFRLSKANVYGARCRAHKSNRNDLLR